MGFVWLALQALSFMLASFGIQQCVLVQFQLTPSVSTGDGGEVFSCGNCLLVSSFGLVAMYISSLMFACLTIALM